MTAQVTFLPRRRRVHSTSVVLGKFTRLFCTDESYTLPSLFAAVLLRRCKYKKNLANNVQCEPYFLKNNSIFLEISHFVSIFSSFFRFICLLYTLFQVLLPANVRNKHKKRKKQRNHFFHLALFVNKKQLSPVW